MKKYIRLFIRKLLFVRQLETIADALDRHYIKLDKILYKKKYGLRELRDACASVGLQKGDVVLVHASWRRFYNFKGSPDDVISLIEQIIGPNGTLLMPSYGSSRLFFDISHTPSCAGILSEIFRKQSGVTRSCCTHFSVAGKGPHTSMLFEEAFHSIYGFDNKSPYYKLHQLPNAKILYLGLGKIPSKVSMIHCASYFLCNKLPIFKNLLSQVYSSILIVDGREYKKNMVTRAVGCRNNKRIFKKIVSLVKKKKRIKLSNLHIVLINANELFNQAVSYLQQGHSCYKGL